jgi:hypothetical protein
LSRQSLEGVQGKAEVHPHFDERSAQFSNLARGFD